MRLHVVITCALISVTVAAQAKPDFSGTWTREIAPSAGAPAAPSPIVLVIAHDEQTLTQTLGKSALVFRLDGSETTNEMPGNAGPVSLKSRARWFGPRLALEMSGPTGRVMQVLSLSNDGKQLTVDTVREGRDDIATVVFTRR